MIIVLMGAPGAGKGTQADLLSDRSRFRKISTGDALRKHVKMGSPVGKQAGELMAKGELAPDALLLQILREEMGNNPKEIIILDGYPRNLAQAETLRTEIESVHPVKGCVHLDVGRSALIERLSGRRVCSACGATFHVTSNPPKHNDKCDKCSSDLVQRPDDDAKSIVVRLDIYDRTTEPVLEFYRQRGLYHRVSGVGQTDSIFGDVNKTIQSCIN